jgi:Uma2 family endonuclease
MTVSDHVERQQAVEDGVPPPWIGQQMLLDTFLALPYVKPNLEYTDGRVTQKVSPKLIHATLQEVVVTRFNEVARPRRLGRAWPELRFVVPDWAPVPDVAYYRRERIRLRGGRFPVDLFEPPDIAVEIVSPGQSVTDLVKKCLRYIGVGTTVALVVDPGPETVLAFRAGQPLLALQGDDRIDLEDVLPGIELTVRALFESLTPDDWDDEESPESTAERGTTEPA